MRSCVPLDLADGDRGVAIGGAGEMVGGVVGLVGWMTVRRRSLIPWF